MEETKYEALPLTDMSAKNLEETHIEEVVDSRGPDSSENNADENLLSEVRADIEYNKKETNEESKAVERLSTIQ